MRTSLISKQCLTFGRIAVERNLTLLCQAMGGASYRVSAAKKKLEKACSTRSNYNVSGSQDVRTQLEKRDQ
jgi:hypothetical protein